MTKEENKTESSSKIEPSSEMIDPAWYLMEGVRGQGERPDFLEPKYKTLADQAKAYKELQKTLGATAGAPDEYDFGEFKEIIEIENPHIQEFLQYAKSNRISQDAFGKALSTFVNYEKSKAPNIEAEIAKLGTDGAQRIDTIQRWAENNFSEKSLETLGKISTRADVIEFLDELRQFQYHTTSHPPAMTADSSSFKPLTVAEIQTEIETNYPKYLSDPNYRKKITEMIEQAVG